MLIPPLPALRLSLAAAPLAVDVPLPADLLQGQPVTIAAIIAMVLVVWILAPLVRMAFEFVLKVLPTIQKLSDSATQLADDVKDMQSELGKIQAQTTARDTVIAADRARQEGINTAMNNEIGGLKTALTSIDTKLDTLINRSVSSPVNTP